MDSALVTALADLEEDQALAIVRQRLDAGDDPLELFEDARKAMEIVGERFAAGEYFIPELVFAGEILKEVSALVKPRMTTNAQGPRAERVIIGTVAGDIHDIGKDIVVFMLDVNGFEVVDLGVDVPAERFVEAIEQTGSRVVGLSGFLTIAFQSMKDTVAAIADAGLREKVKIMIGGGPIDEHVRTFTGADAFGTDAMSAVDLAKAWLMAEGGGNMTASPDQTKPWAELSADERRTARIATWMAAEGVTFQSREAQTTYRQNVQRLVDAIELKRLPDRVPTLLNCTFMPANLYGVAPYDMMYDVEVLTGTVKRFLVDYETDYYFTPAIIGSGQVFETLDLKQLAWPGHGVSKESGYQYIEGEYMADEDYHALIADPSDFWLRRYLPRACGALEPLSRIPPWTDLWEIVLVAGQMIPFGAPDVQAALRALLEAGSTALAWAEHVDRFDREAMGMGFVSSAGALSKAPFDIVADTLRGTRAVMLDLRRRPELLLAAIERLTPLAIRQGVDGATRTGNPIVFMPLHKGADGFMSDEQFRTFYWPTLRAVVLGLIEEGAIPFLFCEGGYDTRLEYLAELPAGTTFCLFDRTDMVRAKELLGGRVCIGGNVPASLILTGTADDVRSYCKDLIDRVAPGGGYVMAFGTAMDEGKPDTVHEMVRFTKEYGVYR